MDEIEKKMLTAAAATEIPSNAAEPDPGSLASLDPIIREARQRLDRAMEWEAESRRRFLEDIKFRHGDADNGYQWPNAIRHSRDVDQRPCLTMNVVRQHNLQIVNQARQNKSSIKIMASGGGASAESAQIFKWLIKHIEYNSNAQSAYQIAREFQVDGGYGWWRITTDYESADSFDQEIYIRPVPDPLNVLIDPDAKQRDKSDARWAFVFDIVPKDEFREAYPEIADLLGELPLGASSTGGDWIPRDHIMVAEYFRKVQVKDQLLGFVLNGERKALRRSKMPPELARELLEDPETISRDVWIPQIEWYLIVGDQVIDQTIWPGKWIPLIMVLGEETIIEGILDRKGHTRAMKDAQRMYNYNASAQVEFGALQSKTPWIAPALAIEEYQQYWGTANQVNHSVLPFKHIDDEGNPVPPPFRQEPPTASPAYQSGMETAFNQMMMTSGQWQNQMGMMGNERTGLAIQERQAQSDTSVFHFEDNYGEALRFTGKQLIDLIPKIYDTKRVRRLVTDDGTELEVEIDPAQAQAFAVTLNHQEQVIRRVFNPSVGMYDVAADVGPAQGTKRQESAQALTTIITQAPALTGIIGDLLMKSLDFDEAQEAAQRLRRMVPPQALGIGPSPAEQALQQQNQALQGALAKSLQRGGAERLKLVGKDQMRDIDVYKAETDRMTALQKLLPTDSEGLASVIDQLVKDTLATHLLPILEANQANLGGDMSQEQSQPVAGAGAGAGSAPVEGARQAPDGEWYLADPTRVGKYLRVVPLAQERRPRGIISNA